MRVSSLFVKSVAIIGAGALGVVLAQDRMPQPPAGSPPQTGRGGAAARGAPPLPGAAPAARPLDEVTYRQQVGYAIGHRFGTDLRANEIVVDPQSLVAGLNDALQGAKPKWTEPELMAAMQRFELEMRQKTAARVQQIVAKNKQQADAFLAANKQKEGVQVTPSGLQYKVLKQGNGPSPTPIDVVRFHYRGTFIDGNEFQSSFGGPPAELRVRELIPGWTEAMQKMHVGDRWQLFVPSTLAYGDQPQPDSPIEPGAMLIFEVELLDIVKQ
jgi:FKBP-type peptidyl-prolyl cis-trans isomerase